MDGLEAEWLLVLICSITGGGLTGWVAGHKLKQSPSRLLTTPLALQSGPTATTLIIIGLALIGLTFSFGVWEGVLATTLGFITATAVSVRTSATENESLGKVIKITTITLLLALLATVSYQYYQFNRAPNEQDRLAFIYLCDEHIANDIFKGKSRDTAKAICSCLWPDLVGRYQSVGKINAKVRSANGDITIRDKEVHAMSTSCLQDYHDSI